MNVKKWKIGAKRGMYKSAGKSRKTAGNATGAVRKLAKSNKMFSFFDRKEAITRVHVIYKLQYSMVIFS